MLDLEGVSDVETLLETVSIREKNGSLFVSLDDDRLILRDVALADLDAGNLVFA